MEVEFRLPWPPSLNTYYVCIRGIKVLSKKDRIYAQEVKRLVQQYGVNYLIDCDVEVEIKLAPPRNGIWDGDNFTKAVFDAIVKADVLVDDFQVVFYSVRKLKKYAMGEVYIKINKVESEIECN